MALHKKVDVPDEPDVDINPIYVQEAGHEVPKHTMPRRGMLPATALQVVRDELILDGNARLNLATFVTTWMEPQAERAHRRVLGKNMIDKDEYPQTAELESRCVSILANLWHAPRRLGGDRVLDHRLQRGLHARRDGAARGAGASAAGTGRPNLVMGANVQVCWEKFCRYWRGRAASGAAGAGPAPPDRPRGRCPRATRTPSAWSRSWARRSTAATSRWRRSAASSTTSPPAAARTCPSTWTRASGGFIAPFLHPELVWDFRVPRVASINASGHKYGLVYPGVGWVVWRDSQALPEDLVFKVNYLGGQMPTFALNFSRPGAQVVAQYYNFLRLGFEGYRRVQQACQDVALHLSSQIARMGPFELLTDGSELPVFAFTLAGDQAGYSVFDLSDRLRTRGWLVPAYTLPANLADTAVLRDRGPQRLQP